MDDDVALQSVGSRLAMADVLDLLGRDTKLLEDVVEHLSKTPVAQTINGMLNCWYHLKISPEKGDQQTGKDKPCIKRCKVGTYNQNRQVPLLFLPSVPKGLVLGSSMALIPN